MSQQVLDPGGVAAFRERAFGSTPEGVAAFGRRKIIWIDPGGVAAFRASPSGPSRSLRAARRAFYGIVNVFPGQQ